VMVVILVMLVILESGRGSRKRKAKPRRPLSPETRNPCVDFPSLPLYHILIVTTIERERGTNAGTH